MKPIADILLFLLCALLVGCGRSASETQVSAPAETVVWANRTDLTSGGPISDEFERALLPARLGPVAQQLRQAYATATPEMRHTANVLLDLATSGEMTGLRRAGTPAVSALAHHLADQMSLDELSELISAGLRLPYREFATREEAVATVLDMFDALTGDAPPTALPSALVMTDTCDREGRVTGAAHVIPAGSPRVYAVFENDRSLAGMSEVYAVWRKPMDNRLVFSETEPVHTGSHYNYVWLALADGWPAGNYQLELYDPARPSLLLASETFTVR